MPHFAPNGDHLKEHEGIHKGLDEYVAYVAKCKNDRKQWDSVKMKSLMDSFRDILFKHLDHEVQSLRGEEMKKVPTLLGKADSSVLEIGRAEKDANMNI